MPDASAPDALRCTAAILSATPTVSARFVHDDRVILEVRRPPHHERDHPMLPPCWFRALVADAAGHGAPGGAQDRRRLETLARCRIEIGVRGGTSILPGNVVRAYGGPSWLHLLAVASPLEDVQDLAGAAFEESADVDPEVPFELHAARDLGVTVLGLASARTAAASESAAELLRTIGMRVAVDRLERQLQQASEATEPHLGGHRRDP